MRNKALFLAVGFGLMLSQGVWADVLEIRGRGYVNGKILAEEGDVVRLQSAGGKVESIHRRDILFREEDLPTHEMPKKSNWDFFKKFEVGQWLGMAREKFYWFVEDIKRRYPDVLKKIEGFGKPMARPASSRQGSVYADAVGKAHTVSRAQHKRVRTD